MGVVCDTWSQAGICACNTWPQGRDWHIMLALLGPSGDLVPESGVCGQRGVRCTAELHVELVPRVSVGEVVHAWRLV